MLAQLWASMLSSTSTQVRSLSTAVDPNQAAAKLFAQVSRGALVDNNDTCVA